MTMITVDCDNPGYIQADRSIRPEHQIPGVVRGMVTCDPAKMSLYLDEAQKTGRMVGTELAKRLAGKSLLSVLMLNHLQDNPQLIPKSWKKDERGNIRYIFFWGTIFCTDEGVLYVQCLYWLNRRWRRNYFNLVEEFSDRCPTALLEDEDLKT